MANHSFYDGPLFHINKWILDFFGLWPYSTGWSKLFKRFLFEGAMITSMVPHLLACIFHIDDIDRFMLSCLACITLITMISKLAGLILAEKPLKNLFDELAENWMLITDAEEKKVLIQYAVRGQYVLVCYALAMLIFGLMISMLPLTPKILDLLFPLESGRARKPIYLLEGEFFVDRESNFILIFICDVIATMCSALTTICGDTCYIAVAQQSCALYTIVSRRLKSLRPRGSDLASQATDQTSSYDFLISTMRLHRTALNFTKTIETAYSMCFCCILVTNLILIPLTACAVLANNGDLVKFTPYALLFSALLIHLYTLFTVGQRIVNHAEVVYDSSFSNEWYNLPKATQKLLMFFMLRSSVAPVIAAGGIFLMNYETYATIMRTSISYITVMASFR